MKTLDDVLKELNDAEKEFKEKCIKYGIEENPKKKSTNLKEDKQNKVNQEG